MHIVWKRNCQHVTAISANDIWAVGLGRNTNERRVHGLIEQVNHLLVLRWNGKVWQRVQTPTFSLSDNLPNSFASGIAVYGGRQVWIVGNENDSDGGSSSALILGQLTCP